MGKRIFLVASELRQSLNLATRLQMLGHQVIIVGAAASDTAGIPPWGPAAADVVLCLTDERPSAALVGRCRALGAGRIIFIHRPDGFLMQEVNALGQGNNSRLVRLFGGEVGRGAAGEWPGGSAREG